MPNANSPGGFYEAIEPVPLDIDEYLAKVDHTISTNQRLSISYFRSGGNQLESLLGNPAVVAARVQVDAAERHGRTHVDAVGSDAERVARELRVRNFGGRVSTPDDTPLASFGSNYFVQEPAGAAAHRRERLFHAGSGHQRPEGEGVATTASAM